MRPRGFHPGHAPSPVHRNLVNSLAVAALYRDRSVRSLGLTATTVRRALGHMTAEHRKKARPVDPGGLVVPKVLVSRVGLEPTTN
jgi:hypothetical protein